MRWFVIVRQVDRDTDRVKPFFFQGWRKKGRRGLTPILMLRVAHAFDVYADALHARTLLRARGYDASIASVPVEP